MRYDSCRQCTKRRIKCDKGAPRCSKCVKKGLECSGVGKTYRFVKNYTSRVVKASTLPRGPSSSARPQQGDQAELNDESNSYWERLQTTLDQVRVRSTEDADEDFDVEATVASPPCPRPRHADAVIAQQSLLQASSFTVIAQEVYPPLRHALQTHRPEQMMLFDHCKY